MPLLHANTKPAVEPIILDLPEQQFFQRIALPLAKRGLKVMPVRGKIAFLENHPSEATTDARKITEDWKRFGNCNVAVHCIQEDGGTVIVDVDGFDLAAEYAKQTGKSAPETYRVESTPATDGGVGKQHWYFRQTARTLALPKNITEESTDGKFSLRVKNYYVIGEGSIHPKHGGKYASIGTSERIPMPDDFLDWLLSQVKETAGSFQATAEGKKEYVPLKPDEKICEHGRNNACRDYAFQRWVVEGCTEDELKADVYTFNDEHCVPPLSTQELDSTVLSSTPKKQQRKDLIPLFSGVPGGTTPAPVAVPVSKVQIIESTGVAPEIVEETDSDAIPEFDETIITGLAAKCVELARRGTTLLPQFVYQTFRALLGSRMAGKVKFDLLDDEPLYHMAFIGETGSGKSEAVVRMMQIFKPIGLVSNAGFKFTSGVDSGAGLKDLFFEIPEHLPVVCHVDEIATIGHAAHSTRNPSILDVVGELANGRRISRTLVKRNGGSKSKDDARLTVIYCGQEGAVYANAFAGRALLGMWDRLYPEFGIAVEPGDKPPIDPVEACKLKEQIDALDYSGTISMGIPAKAYLDDYWDSLPDEVRKKARFRRNLMLDAYLEAFQNGRRTVEISDAKVATKLFDRTTAIRNKEFTIEVPDRIGHYIGLMKKLTAKMEGQIATGVPLEFVALSKRDFETQTNAFRLNELHIFNKAWPSYAPSYLRLVKIRKQNGQEYDKFLPAFQDDGKP